MALNLSKILVDLGHKPPPLKLTMAAIIDSIEAFCSEYPNDTPKVNSGLIKHGRLKSLMEWETVNNAIRSGGYKLSEDPEWQNLKTKFEEEDKKLTLTGLLIELGYKGRNLIKITPEMRRNILSEMERTQVGFGALVNNATQAPEGISGGMIKNWLNENRVKLVEKYHVEWALSEWDKHPDALEITDEIRGQLRSLIENKATGVRSLVRQPDAPAGLTASMVNGWVYSNQKYAQKTYVEWVIEAYSTHPDVVVLDDETKTELLKEKERTNSGARALFKRTKLTAPEGLSEGMLSTWLSKAGVEKVRKDHLEWVLLAYKGLPSFVPLSKSQITLLEDEINRTGLGPIALINGTQNNEYDLKSSTIYGWLKGSTSKARMDHYNWSVEEWGKHPTTLEVTDDMRSQIRQEMQRTGIGSTLIFQYANNPPENFSTHDLETLLNGGIKRVEEGHWNWLIVEWKKHPNVSKKLKLSDKQQFGEETRTLRGHLVFEVKRTGLGAKSILDIIDTPPEGLTIGIINHWLKKKAWSKTVRKDHYDAVLNVLRSTPSRKEFAEVPLSAEAVKLQAERDRTGVGHNKLLEGKKLPAGLSMDGAANILYGAYKSVRQDHYDFLMSEWSKLPDKDYKLLDYSNDMKAALLAQKERTRVGVVSLLSNADNIPDGLSVGMANHLLRGDFQKIRDTHYKFLMSAYENLPDNEHEYILLEGAALERLRRLKTTKFIGPSTLLKEHADAPDGLNHSLISGWFSGHSKTARRDHIEWLLEKWEQAPDLVFITEDISLRLRQEIERTGVKPINLLKKSEEQPAGITQLILYGWIDGRIKTANKDLLNWVFEEFKKYEEFTPSLSEMFNDHQGRTNVGAKKLLSSAETIPEGVTEALINSWLKGTAKGISLKHKCWAVSEWLKKPDVVYITDEIVSEINGYKAQTGLGYTKLLKAATPPDGLTGSKLKTLFAGKATTVEKQHLEWIRNTYRNLTNDLSSDMSSLCLES